MPLILTIKPTRGGGDRQIRTLAQGTLSIGRAPGNDWVLADPDQHLSRTHCMVAFEGGRYVLTDLSTNGLLINGAREPTTRNSRTVLTDGDTVRLGNYMLEVAEADDAAAGPSANPFGAGSFVTSRTDPFAVPNGGQGGAGARSGEGPLDVDPLDDPLGHPDAEDFHHPLPHPPPSVRMEDPFDLAEEKRRRTANPEEDLFHGETSPDAWQGPAMRDAGGPGSQSYSAPRVVEPVNFNEIDFDALLGDVAPTPSAHPLAPPKPAAPPMPAPLADSLDDLLGDFPLVPESTPKSAPAGAPPGAPGRAASGAAAAPAAYSDADSSPFGAPTAAPAGRAAPPVAPVPIAPGPIAPGPATPTSTTPAAGGNASAAAMVAAFLEGAGLPPTDLSAQDPEATMRAIGALFRAFTGGTRDVLMSRAEIKHEMRVEQTMMRSRDNNALKFSVSPDEAMAALLQPNRPGYKAPLAAVEEAFTDIRSHEMAVMAGLQTALIALLKRFDPAGLEARLQRGMLDGILPGARKARFWELFCTTYKDIAREAEDDFHSVFGREFARAYDAQVRKL